MTFSIKNQNLLFNNRSVLRTLFKSLLLIIVFSFSAQTEAQIFKKLAKKAENAVERTLEKKVDEKATRETDKAFDSTLNNSSNKKKKKNRRSEIPLSPMGSSKTPESTYRFSHKYKLEMTSGKRTTEIIYYLNSHGDYTASTIPDTRGTNMITVMDMKNKAMFMFMENDGNKQLMAMNFDMDIEDMVDDAVDETEYSAKPTGRTKTILGYPAKEYETKGKNMHGIAWITTAVDVSLFKAFSAEKTKKGMDKSWMKNMNGLLLEMTMTDTSKRKPSTVTMTCKELTKHNLTIDSSQYKKMF